MCKFLVFIFAACAAFSAHATSFPEPVLIVGDPTNQPNGYPGFCYAYPGQCVARGSTDPQRLTAAKRAELRQVNLRVNRSDAPVEDLDYYNKDEAWLIPSQGYGDCEDYVLFKRKLLVEKGWSTSDLLIAVVFDEVGDGHAVLIARTTRGDLVLDNKNDDVKRWYETPYHFVKRQSAQDPNIWVSLTDSRAINQTITGSTQP